MCKHYEREFQQLKRQLVVPRKGVADNFTYLKTLNYRLHRPYETIISWLAEHVHENIF